MVIRVKTPSPLAMIGDRHFSAVHGMRLMCALAIMANHWSSHYYARFMSQGQIPVDFFFGMEGLLAAAGLSECRTSPIDYLRSKTTQILPLLFVGLLLGMIAASLSRFAGIEHWTFVQLSDVALHNLLLQPSFTGLAEGAVFPINPPSWAIVLELLALSALCLSWRRLSPGHLGKVIIVGAVGIIVPAILWQDMNVGWRTEHFIFGYARVAFDFSVGIAIALTLRGTLRRDYRVSAALPLVIFCILLVARVRFVGIPIIFFGLPFTIVLAFVAYDGGLCSYVGEFGRKYALGVYLVHFPVISVLNSCSRIYEVPIGFRKSYICLFICATFVLLLSVAVVRTVDLVRDTASRSAKLDDGYSRHVLM